MPKLGLRGSTVLNYSDNSRMRPKSMFLNISDYLRSGNGVYVSIVICY